MAIKNVGENSVVTKGRPNSVSVRTVRIASDYHYAAHSQAVRTDKERE